VISQLIVDKLTNNDIILCQMFDMKTMYYSVQLKFEVLYVICVSFPVSFVNFYVIKTALSYFFMEWSLMKQWRHGKTNLHGKFSMWYNETRWWI
jgi:hypothetical protein